MHKSCALPACTHDSLFYKQLADACGTQFGSFICGIAVDISAVVDGRVLPSRKKRKSQF